MSAHVLFRLLNELEKSDKKHFIAFCNKFNTFNNT